MAWLIPSKNEPELQTERLLLCGAASLFYFLRANRKRRQSIAVNNKFSIKSAKNDGKDEITDLQIHSIVIESLLLCGDVFGIIIYV